MPGLYGYPPASTSIAKARNIRTIQKEFDAFRGRTPWAPSGNPAARSHSPMQLFMPVTSSATFDGVQTTGSAVASRSHSTNSHQTYVRSSSTNSNAYPHPKPFRCGVGGPIEYINLQQAPETRSYSPTNQPDVDSLGGTLNSVAVGVGNGSARTRTASATAPYRRSSSLGVQGTQQQPKRTPSTRRTASPANQGPPKTNITAAQKERLRSKAERSLFLGKEELDRKRRELAERRKREAQQRLATVNSTECMRTHSPNTDRFAGVDGGYNLNASPISLTQRSHHDPTEVMTAVSRTGPITTELPTAMYRRTRGMSGGSKVVRTQTASPQRDGMAENHIETTTLQSFSLSPPTQNSGGDARVSGAGHHALALHDPAAPVSSTSVFLPFAVTVLPCCHDPLLAYLDDGNRGKLNVALAHNDNWGRHAEVSFIISARCRVLALPLSNEADLVVSLREYESTSRALPADSQSSTKLTEAASRSVASFLRLVCALRCPSEEQLMLNYGATKSTAWLVVARYLLHERRFFTHLVLNHTGRRRKMYGPEAREVLRDLWCSCAVVASCRKPAPVAVDAVHAWAAAELGFRTSSSPTKSRLRNNNNNNFHSNKKSAGASAATTDGDMTAADSVAAEPSSNASEQW
eukprot:PhM_4_TR7506/c1_g1_i1/m.99744